MSRFWLIVAITAVGLSAAACSSSGAPPSSTSVAPPVTSGPPTVISSAPPVTSVAAPTPVSSVAAPSSVAPSSVASTAPAGPRACTAADVAVSSQPGGSFQGQEIAGVIFTNSSTATCTLRGYPFVRLEHKGAPLGQPAMHDVGTVRTVVLKPGDAAQAQLTALSTCQAAESDHAQVRLPGSTTSADVAIQLRGCTLKVQPIEGA